MRNSFSNILDIPWQEFEVVLGAKNSFLQRNLNITSREHAVEFLNSCGFDISNNVHVKQLEQFFGESLFLIRHILISEEECEKLRVPTPLLQLDDPCNLLIYASSRSPRKRYLRLWSCAILKVMYTIANLQYSGRLHIIDDARDQIFKKIRHIVHEQNEKNMQLKFKDICVSLKKIEWKEAKTRSSITLKLLHKPDSIVDEVFDYLGVRFVVESSKEIPLVLKLLIESDIIIPHQVVALRTRNSLINIKAPKKTLHFLKELRSCGTLTEHELKSMCENINWENQFNYEEPQKRTNVSSSQHYRSLQLTVRHLVRTLNPAYLVLESNINQLRRYTGLQKQEPWMGTVIPQYLANYFPIEIQIMDLESYESAKFGPASHEQYKAQQIKVIRERVLGSLLNFNKEKFITQEV